MFSLDVTKSSQSASSQPRRDNKMVREDSQIMKLDSFIEFKSKSDHDSISNSESSPRLMIGTKRSAKRKAELDLTMGGIKKRKKLTLESMNQLREERIKSIDTELKNILKNFTVVGSLLPSKFIIQEGFRYLFRSANTQPILEAYSA